MCACIVLCAQLNPQQGVTFVLGLALTDMFCNVEGGDPQHTEPKMMDILKKK